MSLTITKATKEHIAGVYALVEELAIYEKARHEMTMTLEAYHKAYDEGQFDCIVALKEGKVIGTCIYYDTFSTWKGKMLYLEDFVVLEDHRKSGVGQQLFDKLISIGKENKYSLVKWQVLDWNEPAIKFYEKNKSTIEKEWWNCKIVF